MEVQTAIPMAMRWRMPWAHGTMHPCHAAPENIKAMSAAPGGDLPPKPTAPGRIPE